MLFAALHESAVGTKRTRQRIGAMSVIGGKADNGKFWPAMVCPLLTPKADNVDKTSGSCTHKPSLLRAMRLPLLLCDVGGVSITHKVIFGRK
jgi:hypothetical protein